MTIDLKTILEERGSEYGDFTEQAQISQALQDITRAGRSYTTMDSYQREALAMILHKISRIVNGNTRNVDSWADIAGYATLVANRLQK
jgi:Domain of unknown function (DUF6378)